MTVVGVSVLLDHAAVVLGGTDQRVGESIRPAQVGLERLRERVGKAEAVAEVLRGDVGVRDHGNPAVARALRVPNGARPHQVAVEHVGVECRLGRVLDPLAVEHLPLVDDRLVDAAGDVILELEVVADLHRGVVAESRLGAATITPLPATGPPSAAGCASRCGVPTRPPRRTPRRGRR